MVQRSEFSSRRLVLAMSLLLAGCSACGNKSPAPEPAVQADEATQAAEPAPEPAQPGVGLAPDPQGELNAHLLVGESPNALYDWTKASPDVQEQGLGMVEDVVFGQRLFVRMALTGIEGAAPFELTGTMILRGPDGRVLHEQAMKAGQDDLNAEAPGVVVLLPGMDIVFDPGDAAGTYNIECIAESSHSEHTVVHQLRVAGQGLQLDPAMAL